MTTSRRSNQYTAGGSRSAPVARPVQSQDIVAALDAESAVWGFLGPEAGSGGAGVKRAARGTIPRLATSPASADRIRAGRLLSSPPEVLELLSGDSNKDVRLAVVNNPRCPAAILERLVTDPDVKVRRRIAKHPSTPASAQRVLADDETFSVQRHLAANPNLDSEAAETISLSSDRLTLNTIAANSSVSPDLRERAHERANP